MISKKQMKLSVGAYSIHILYPRVEDQSYYLPDSVEPFLDRIDTYMPEWDITYTIQPEDAYKEPSDVPIAGFDDGPEPYKIYRVKSGGYLWIRMNKNGRTQLAYRISEDWSSWRLIVDNSGNLGIGSFAELAYIFAYSVLNKGGILFHGVVMEWMDMGVMVCAHSGVGKTTHTRMWRDTEHARIMNGDRALCCQDNKSWYTCGAPWSGSSGEALNRRVALKAIVILEQAESNQVTVLSPLQGALELIQLAFAPTWEENLLNCSLDHIDHIVQNIPVLKLRCRPDMEAVSVLKAELIRLEYCYG